MLRLYCQYHDDVFRHCVHRLFDRHAAEDVTAEIFLKIVEHLHRFNGDERQLRPWIYRIATNSINNHLRKTVQRRGLRQRLIQRSRYHAEGQPEPPKENLVLLKDALLSLKPRYQTIITLRFFENRRSKEIAQMLGCTPGTARSQLARAVAQLRKKLTAAGALGSEGDRHE